MEAAQAELHRRKSVQAAQAELQRRRAAQSQEPQADMSIMGRIKDNVIGVDDGVMSTGEKIATALNLGGESLTLGVVGDEAAAAADNLVGRGPYDERLQFHRGNEQQFKEENPAIALGAELAPALIPGVGAGAALAKGANIVGRAGAAAIAGAGAGGLYGFTEGEGGAKERAKNAAFTAGAGALFGAAAPRMTDFAANIPSKVKATFSRSFERPTVKMLQRAKNDAYKAVDNAGELFSGDAMTGLSQKVRGAIEGDNYVEGVDNALTATMAVLDKRAGKPTTLSQLDRVRQNLWTRYGNAKDQPQILDAIRLIDETIESTADGSELMSIARAANSRYAKSKLLEDAFTKATDQTAGSGSGGNILNKYRQAVTLIINNEKKAKFFSPAEIDMMRGFVRGSLSENVKRQIGKLSPNGNGLMMALHVIGGVASSGATVPVMAVGAFAKNSADNSAMRGASAIQDYLAGVPQKVIANTGNVAPSAVAASGAVALEDAQAAARKRLFQAQEARR